MKTFQLLGFYMGCINEIPISIRAQLTFRQLGLTVMNDLVAQTSAIVGLRLKSSLRKFFSRYGDLTKQYEVPLSRMLHDILDDDHIQ